MTITFDDAVQKHKLEDLHKDEEEELVKILSDKYGLPYIDLRGIAPEPDAMRVVKEEETKAASAVPFKIVGRKLYVATTSPSNPKFEELYKPLERNYDILLFLCSHASLEHVFDRYKDINESAKVVSGVLALTKENMQHLMTTFDTVDELKKEFEQMAQSQQLYKVTHLIELMMAGALRFDASDIHIEPEEDKVRLRYRLNGVLQDVAYFDFASLKQMTSRLKLLSGLKLSTIANAQDGRFSVDLGEVEVEIRVSIIPGNYGESFVMRLLDPRHAVSNLDNIAFPPKIRELLDRALAKPNGVVLTTGPTGSGKTTTLYAFLHKVYSPEVKIITIEDPVEYHLEGITQTQVEEEKGYTFLSGLRAALRQDPDIIMVGEIRDQDTAKVAINAALTGHLVFSTLHTNNAAGTIPRLIDLGVNPKVIGGALSVALAQRLVRTLCNECKKPVDANEKEARIITNILGAMKTEGKEESMNGFIPDTHYSIFAPVGCEHCGGSGYAGRVGIFEALVVTPDVERALVGNPGEREIRDAAQNQRIPTLREDAILKVLAGLTSVDEVGKVVDLYSE
jgi:type IV pilus assembly protein PilB